MTSSRKPDPREIIRDLLDSDVPLSERAAALLLRLASDGAPAGSRPEHPPLAATLGPLYRSSVLISWPSRSTLGHRLRWGQAGSGRPERTPEQVREAQKKAVQRAEKELISLGVAIVLPKAGPSHRADRRPNLYAIDLEACQRLTRGHQRPPVDTGEGTYEGSPATPGNDLRGVTGVIYEGSPATPKEQIQEQPKNKEQSLSSDRLKGESTNSEEREIISALLDSNFISKPTDREGQRAARELIDLGASPEQVRNSRQAWQEMGRTYHLGLSALIRNWASIAEWQRQQEKDSQPAEAQVINRNLCPLCQGPARYSTKPEHEGPSLTDTCFRLHSGEPHDQPSEEWLKENDLEPVI